MARPRKEQTAPAAHEEAADEAVLHEAEADSVPATGIPLTPEGPAPQSLEDLQQQNEALREQMAAMQEENKKQAEQMDALLKKMETMSQPTIIQMAPNEERVHFLWQAEVAPENIKTFGPNGMYGRIVGKTGSFYVPKSDLSRIMDEENRHFLDKRWLIVVNGLDEEERKAWGVEYKEGEILDKGAFAELVEMGDELLDLFPALCHSHKVIVAQRYRQAYLSNDPNVTRERVTKLKDLARAAGMDPNPFVSIIEMMNEHDKEA